MPGIDQRERSLYPVAGRAGWFLNRSACHQILREWEIDAMTTCLTIGNGGILGRRGAGRGGRHRWSSGTTMNGQST